MAQAPPCPYCGALEYKLIDERWLACKGCGHEFDIQHDLCPSCGYLNPAAATTCGHCQSGLRKDPVDRMFETLAKGRAQWHEERLGTSLVQKKRDVAASEQRMAAFLAEDQERRETIARALAESRKRERRAMLIIGIIGVVVVVALATATFILMKG
jgi:predicted nucleic acid-binding Zn ribbon protein